MNPLTLNPNIADCPGPPAYGRLGCSQDLAMSSRLLVIALLPLATLTGCSAEVEEAGCNVAKITTYADDDGDGFGDATRGEPTCGVIAGRSKNADDCDDTNFNITLATEEVCDGIDNNCDGVIDEGIEPPVWYADADGDGHGDVTVFAQTCVAPAGYTDTYDDCDDADATNAPSIEETCDGLDNDCDGVADNGFQLTYWFEDTDGDGYGNPELFVETCDSPTGYTENDEDCNDGDDAIHPGAVEVCDHADNDCNGLADGSDGLPDCGDWFEDFEALTFASVWNQGGTAPWTISSANPYSGSSSALSGVITHNETSDLSINLVYGAAGDISFWFDTSTESNYDYLRFLVDGVEQDRWSGTNGWQQVTYPITAGAHTLTWRYTKDGSVDGGNDAVKVDLIEAFNASL